MARHRQLEASSGRILDPAFTDMMQKAALGGQIYDVPRGVDAVHAAALRDEQVLGVLSGTMRKSRIDFDGHRQISAFLFAGDWVWLEERFGHPTAVEAITDAQVLRLPRRYLAESGPGRSSAMEDILQASLDSAQDRVFTLGQKSALNKLAAFLLTIADRIAEGSAEVQLPMSRYDIADYLGLRSETVCRTLSHMVADGLIALPTSQRVRLLERQRLEELLA